MTMSSTDLRDVGTLPLSKELEARSGKKEKLLTVYSFCSPATARRISTAWRISECIASAARSAGTSLSLRVYPTSR